MNPVLVKPEIVLFPQMHAVEEFLKNFEASAHLSPDTRLTIDLETTGLDPHKGRITVVGMSADGHTVFIVDPSEIPIKTFRRVMQNNNLRKVFHNAKFDIKWLMKHFDCKFNNADCTYVMRKLLTTGLELKADLKSLSWEMLGITLDKEVREEFIGATVITQEMAEYAAMDVVTTHLLYDKLSPRLEEEELLEVYDYIEKPLISVVAKMELRGINVNVEYLRRMQDLLEAKIVVFQQELNDLVRAFGAMPTKQRKLKVAEKKTWPTQPAPDYVEEAEPFLNINSSKQVTSVLNLIGFAVKGSSKEVLENPTYTAQSIREARRRLENISKNPAKYQTYKEVIKPAEPKTFEQMTKAQQLEALQKRLNAIEAGTSTGLEPEKPSVAKVTEKPVSGPSELPILFTAGMLDEDVLPLAFDVAQRILDLRMARKAVDGFLIPLQTEHINSVTGKIHTSFNQMGTGTGRFSNSEPNFQQMPSARKDGVFGGMTFREAFVPSAGMKMIVYDYQACEVRILAEMTKDKGLIFAMTQDDPHLANAAIMFDVDISEVTKDMRTKAKTAIFTLVYGGGARRIASVLKCAVSQAQHVMDLVFAKFPGIPKFIAAKKATALERGYALSLSGRKRYFDMPVKPEYRVEDGFNYPAAIALYRGITASIERKAQNAPIQATNADITKLAMVWVDEALAPFGGHLLLTIHDELVAEVPEEHAEAAYEAMGEAMLRAEAEFLQEVKCVVDGKIAAFWDH